MRRIAQRHLQEWTIGSGVDREIVSLNLESLELLEMGQSGQEVSNTPIHDRLNWKYTRFGYQVQTDLRGWWVSGVDPLDNYQPMIWGRFKPDSDTPVLDKDKKPAKYLSPKEGINSSRAIFLEVPAEIWDRFCLKYQVPKGAARCFWEWVWINNIPVTLTEGEKKAGCLLTSLYAAIALPGINTGYRTQDNQGRKVNAYLLPEVAHFATPGRRFDICFDYETRRLQLQLLDRAIETLGRLLRLAKCRAYRVELPGPEKGVDDFIVAQGTAAYDQVYGKARSLNPAEKYSQLTYPIQQHLAQRYVEVLNLPEEARLVAIKSPKNTGKTESIVGLIAEAISIGKPVLVITHRVQLGQALCKRFGIPYVTEIRTSEEGRILGYGVCVDSLHPESQARFSARFWKEAIVILDESEQVLWHTLSATTEVKTRRLEILREMRELFRNVLTSESGKVILLDADLSDLSIQFVTGMAGLEVEPYVVVNDVQTPTWTVHHYDHNSPAKLLKSLIEAIAAGEVPFVMTHSQSAASRWSTKTLEALLSLKFPSKRILRIDSETIADPGHAACNCVAHLDEVLGEYDIVLASPSIETGVSIDLKGHFTSVWGFFQGVSSANSVRQALARVRETVPRYIWVAKRGLSFVGNGSTQFRSLIRSEQVVMSLNLRLLDVLGDRVETFDEALTIWGRYACRINCEMADYREFVLDGLKAEGHRINSTTPAGETTTVETEIAAIRDQQKQDEAESIIRAEEIANNEYKTLKFRKEKSQAERYQERKFELRQRYQTEDLTLELIEKDRQGWHPQLRLHYYLTVGKANLRERELAALSTNFTPSGVWIPTFNRSQISAKVWLLETLGLLDLLDPEQVYSAHHPAVIHTAELVSQYRQGIKSVLGINLSAKDTPMAIAQRLLGLIGLKLTYTGRPGRRGEQRDRIYQFVPIEDGRDEVFLRWLERDALKREQAAVSSLGNINNPESGQEEAA